MVETAEAKQVSRAASSMLFPELDFDVADNGTYPSEDFQRVLARISFDNEFANAGAKAYQLARGNDIDVGAESRNPLARALLYHLRGLDADAVDDQFDRVRQAILDEAVRNRLFTQPVDVAIDVHDCLYYGDSDTPQVSRTDPNRGTDCAYKFATVCIVDPGVRFTLGWVPLNGEKTDELADALRQLVSQAREYVEINRVYLDRGFYRVHLALALEELDVEFVMRAPQTRKVQQFIDDHDEDTFVAEYEMARSNPPTGRTRVRLVVVPHRSREDDHFCLVTNREVTRDLAQPLAEAYRRRWGIETSYRKVTEFLPENVLTDVLCPIVLLPVCRSALQSVSVDEAATHTGSGGREHSRPPDRPVSSVSRPNSGWIVCHSAADSGELPESRRHWLYWQDCQNKPRRRFLAGSQQALTPDSDVDLEQS